MMSALLVQPGWSPMARAFAFGLALLTLAASGVSAQTVTWLGTTSSDWNIPDNWSPAGIPGVTADVIVPAAAPAITISTSNVTVQSLTLGRGLTLGGGRTLTVTTANLSAPITLAANAGLSGGTYTISSGGNLTFPGSCTFGRLSNLTINGDLGISGTSIRWNNVVHNGTLTASGTGTSRIAFEGNQTLSSTIISNISSGELRIEQATAGTLTIASTGAIRGGNVTFGPACLGSVGAVINNGTILANTAGRSIDFAANTPVTNTGTITAGPGNITIGGTLTNSGTVTSGTGTVTLGGAVTNTGTINSTGGSVVFNGTVNPLVGTLTGTNFTFGGTIDLAGNTWNLSGRTIRINGTLQNGTVDLTGGGTLTFPASCSFGRLSNLTIDGDLAISGGNIRWNNVVHNGTLTASGSGISRIAFEGNQTLSSTIISNSSNELQLEQATAGTLTIASSGSLRGGNISVGAACFGTNGTVINNGTIDADLPGRSITFAAGTSLTNNGTISAPAGTVNISGTLTGYNAATRTLSGGLFSVASTGRLQLGSPAALTIRTIAAGTVVIVDGPSASLVNSALANVLPDLASVAGSLSLVNRSAAITPSGGTLTVTGNLTLDRTLLNLTGNYSQSPAANLTVSVFGTTPAQYGRITATGAAAVAGTITAQPASGFFPLDTDSFNIVTAASVTGTFSTLVGANGYIPIPSYTPTLARINFASCPFVITQPAAVTACAAGEGSFGVGAIGQPPLAYQWELFTAGSWAPLTDGPLPGIGTIVNAQSDVLTIQNPETTGFQVRVVINNNCGSVTSDPAALTLPPPCSLADVVGVESGASVCADGNIDGADFIAFINSFSIGDATIDPAADVAGGGTGATPDPDGTIDGGDFIAFINAFAIGC